MGVSRINAWVVLAALCPLWLMPTAAADTPKGLYAGLEGGVAWTGPITFEPFYFNCATLGTTTYDYWNGALNLGLRVKF